jgi:hypothetical protein
MNKRLVYFGGRASGKTSALVKYCIENKISIVVGNDVNLENVYINNIKHIAKAMYPELTKLPIKILDYQSYYLLSNEDRNKLGKIAVDNLVQFTEFMTGAKLHISTLDTDESMLMPVDWRNNEK